MPAVRAAAKSTKQKLAKQRRRTMELLTGPSTKKAREPAYIHLSFRTLPGLCCICAAARCHVFMAKSFLLEPVQAQTAGVQHAGRESYIAAVY